MFVCVYYIINKTNIAFINKIITFCTDNMDKNSSILSRNSRKNCQSITTIYELFNESNNYVNEKYFKNESS